MHPGAIGHDDAMKLRHELRYDATPEQVHAMLLDPAFWAEVATATGALSEKTTVSEEGGTTRVVLEQDQRVAGVPSFAKKFVGESTRAIATTLWQGHTGRYTIEAPGKPTSIAGTVSLAGSGPATVLTYDLEVKASVPLIGGKLEKLVADLTAEGFDTEGTVGAAWLERNR